jgi:hypothetical protein
VRVDFSVEILSPSLSDGLRMTAWGRRKRKRAA